MRKLNMFLVIGILATLLAHAIMGSVNLLGADANSLKVVARACFGLIFLHVIITTILTVQTLRARKLSGAGYFKDNLMFWVRRISGFAILIPLIMHLVIFRPSNAGAYRLQVFTTGRMISQVCLVIAIAIHVLTNIKPLLISLGIEDTKSFAVDILFILSALLLLFLVAFAVYYLRWMMV